MAKIIQSVNPYTGEVTKEFELLTEDRIREELALSRKAFSLWRNIPPIQRSDLLANLATQLRDGHRTYAVLITKEMGKPIRESLAEIEKCAWLCDYYAEHAHTFLEPEQIDTEAAKSYIAFEPLGIVLAIMPWNFPFWQALRCGIPAVSAGNAVVLKHASNVPMCALAIEDAFRKAGFPEGVFKTLLIDSRDALRIIDEDMVDAVSLTGSSKAGQKVAAHAGERVRKSVLELGGSDPFIVLDDADIEKAGRMAAGARMINTGQSCIAAKRFIVQAKVADEFRAIFTDRLKELRMGDPMDETTDIGPIAKTDIFLSLNAQLTDARLKGAEIVQIGQKPDIKSKALFFPPCVIYNPTKEMRILSEEVFGPVAPVIVVKDDDEAVEAANDTDFGLGASIWSRDLSRAERLASRLDCGIVAINDTVKSDPRLPFGGVKKSGLGRELSRYGLLEFVNIKSIVIRE